MGRGVQNPQSQCYIFTSLPNLKSDLRHYISRNQLGVRHPMTSMMPKETAQGHPAVLEGHFIDILNEADSKKGTILKIGKSYLPYDLW